MPTTLSSAQETLQEILQRYHDPENPISRSHANALIWRHLVAPHQSHVLSPTIGRTRDGNWRIGWNTFGCRRSHWADPPDYLSGISIVETVINVPASR